MNSIQGYKMTSRCRAYLKHTGKIMLVDRPLIFEIKIPSRQLTLSKPVVQGCFEMEIGEFLSHHFVDFRHGRLSLFDLVIGLRINLFT